MKQVLIKKILPLIICAFVLFIIVLILINQKKSITDLSINEQNKVFDILGLTSYNSVTIKSFQARRYANEGFNLIGLVGIDSIEEFVNANNVIEKYKELDDCFDLSSNSKYFPRNCEYCILLYDDKGRIFLSVRNHSYNGGTELMNYFYELYQAS